MACRLRRSCSPKRARSNSASGSTTTFRTWTRPTSTTSNPTTRPSNTFLTQHFWFQRDSVQVHEKLHLKAPQLIALNLLWHFQDRAHFARVFNRVPIKFLADQPVVWCSQVSLFRNWPEISRKAEHLLLITLGKCPDWDSLPVAIDWQDAQGQNWPRKDHSVYTVFEGPVLQPVHQLSVHLLENVAFEASGVQRFGESQLCGEFQGPGQPNSESDTLRRAKNFGRVLARKHPLIGSFMINFREVNRKCKSSWATSCTCSQGVGNRRFRSCWATKRKR